MPGVLERLARSHSPFALTGELRMFFGIPELIKDPRYYLNPTIRGSTRAMFIPGSFNSEYPVIDICNSWILIDRLRADGHKIIPTGLLMNFPASPDLIAQNYRAIKQQVESATFPDKRLSLVGHSLGGVYAKLLASDPQWRAGRNPIERIITLGFSVNDKTPDKYLDPQGKQVLSSQLADSIDWLAINSVEDPLMARPSRLRPDQVQVFLHGSHGGLVTNPNVFWYVRRALFGLPVKIDPYSSGNIILHRPTSKVA